MRSAVSGRIPLCSDHDYAYLHFIYLFYGLCCSVKVIPVVLFVYVLGEDTLVILQ